MNFGELEEDLYQNDLGYTRGNIGKSGIGGGIRMAQIDERTKVRISQTLKKNMQKQQATWGGTTSIKKHISGTASSVAFTPLQVSKRSITLNYWIVCGCLISTLMRYSTHKHFSQAFRKITDISLVFSKLRFILSV